MPKKLTKTQLKRIGKMHAAAVLITTESMIAFPDLSLDNAEYLDGYFEKLGLRILGDDELRYDSNEIVKYVRDNV